MSVEGAGGGALIEYRDTLYWWKGHSHPLTMGGSASIL